MVKVVLTQKDDSGYKDVPGELYHFPKQYLRAAEEAIGDACLFYEPRRSAGGGNDGRQSYWGTAILVGVRPDPTRKDHYYADLESPLWFPIPVSFKRPNGTFWEAKLDRGDGQVSKGAMGVSVRRIPDEEFHAICAAGFVSALTDTSLGDPLEGYRHVAEDQLEFERPIIENLVSRPFRDRVFAKQVRQAYDSRCAITGLKIINGGGRAEMEAAHIKPVEAKGPDVVRNGLALSRTVHWMFDRGLISIDDNYKLLTVPELLPEGVERLFLPSGSISVPASERDRPSSVFLRWHRENCFKG